MWRLTVSPRLFPSSPPTQDFVCGPLSGEAVTVDGSAVLSSRSVFPSCVILAVVWLLGVAVGAISCRALDVSRRNRALLAAAAAEGAEAQTQKAAAAAKARCARACIPPLDLAGAVARKRATMARTFLERTSGFVIEAKGGEGLGAAGGQGGGAEGMGEEPSDAASIGVDKSLGALSLSNLATGGDERGLPLEPIYAPLENASTARLDSTLADPLTIEVAAEYSEEGSR